MVTRSLDVRKKALTPIPISYLIQTANRFDCDIFVTNDQKTANLKQYDELKNLSLCGFLTICFKGRDETEADNCIRISAAKIKGSVKMYNNA